MWEIVRAGGPIMWPIIGLSVVAAAIVFERFWTLQEKRVLPKDLPPKIRQLIETNQVNDKVIQALEQNSPLGKVLAAGLSARTRPRAEVLERLEDTGRHVVHDLDRFLNTLAMIGSVSPLMGLLGTVTGIISAFTALQEGGAGDPRALAGGIGEALFCTAAGLIVAIPSVFFYRILRGRVDRIAIEIEKCSLRMVDQIEVARREARSSVAA